MPAKSRVPTEAVAFQTYFAVGIERDEKCARNPIACYEAYKKGVPSISQFAEMPNIGFKVVSDWLVLQFSHTAKMFQNKDEINLDILNQIASDVLLTHGNLNPFEIILYLRRLRAGAYGKIAYGRLTPDDILAHLPRFYNERGRELQAHYKQQDAERREREYRETRAQSVSYADYQAQREAFAAAYQGCPEDFEQALINHLKAI